MSCQPAFRSVSAVEAERAFVRDEAEEKNNEANESPTDRNSFRSSLSIHWLPEPARVPPRPLLCDKHGIERVDGTGSGPQPVFVLPELCLSGCLSVQSLLYHMMLSDCIKFVLVLKHAPPVRRYHVRHETRGAQCSQSGGRG
jgi:hypothetical protein